MAGWLEPESSAFLSLKALAADENFANSLVIGNDLRLEFEDIASQFD